MIVPLNEQAQVTLDGSGNGTVRLGPSNVFQVWIPASITCDVSSNTKEPVFKAYLGNSTSGNPYAGTYTGSNDTSGIAGVTLYPGQFITGVWTGGDVGAIATMTMSGDIQIPGGE